ncbi:MAG: hypothetical protein WED34_04490 [Planctomycetales bacterium]
MAARILLLDEIMDKPLYRCMTKGSDWERGTPQSGANWVLARRGFFKVFADRIELGDWRIPFSEIERAIEYRIPCFYFAKSSVLEIEAKGRIYQFGFNPWARPVKHFPFAVEQQQAKLGWSTFSVLLRLAILAYLGYLLWNQ